MAKTELPTRKQKELVKLIVADSGEKTKAEMLLKAGYSVATADHPAKVFRSEGVQKLLALSETIISDDDCLRAVEQAIKSTDKNEKELATKTALAWLRFKYPEQWRPNNHQTVNNTQINISSVEEGAYLFFCDKYKLTKEEIDKKLSL